jgi:hypothetical protein
MAMLQCKDCEFFSRDLHGGVMLRCDPFGTVKEPECIQKLQLIRLDGLLRSYQAVLHWYQKMSPMQEKMMRFMEREINDIDEADRWKFTDESQPHDDETTNDPPGDGEYR